MRPPSLYKHVTSVADLTHRIAARIRQPEAPDSFQKDTGIDESFTWMINLIDQGLLANKSQHCPPRRRLPRPGHHETIG